MIRKFLCQILIYLFCPRILNYVEANLTYDKVIHSRAYYNIRNINLRLTGRESNDTSHDIRK